MRLNIVGKHPAPLPPYECDLFALPIEAVPTLLWGIWLKGQKYFWETPEDVLVAKSLLADTGIGLLMPCGNELGFKIDRLTRLVDSALYGRSYADTGEVDVNGIPIVEPALDNSVSPAFALDASMFKDSAVVRSLVQNLADGTASDYTAEGRNFRQQLEDIRALIETMQGDDIDYTPLLQAIAALLA